MDSLLTFSVESAPLFGPDDDTFGLGNLDLEKEEEDPDSLMAITRSTPAPADKQLSTHDKLEERAVSVADSNTNSEHPTAPATGSAIKEIDNGQLITDQNPESVVERIPTPPNMSHADSAVDEESAVLPSTEDPVIADDRHPVGSPVSSIPSLVVVWKGNEPNAVVQMLSEWTEGRERPVSMSA
jgi:hypothetical protein